MSEPSFSIAHGRARFAAAVLLAFSPLYGCDGDGGSDAGGSDAGAGLEMSTLFGECVDDSQCPGADAVCRTSAEGFPGGYCTVPCEDRTLCDDGFVYNHCLARGEDPATFCELRCLNGLDCGRDGWSCSTTFADGSGACIPVCSSDEQCGDGAMCNIYTGTCTTDAIPTTGSVTGEACDNGDQCKSGACIAEVDRNGVPTGWVGGYCTGNCILPAGYNSNSFFDGPELPNGGCPGDALCIPQTFAHSSQRDLGTCYDACTESGTCRGGYTCLTSFQTSGGAATYPTGICVPGDCTMAGCPTGYECQTLDAGTMNERSVCAPM
ncbi:MAG: hypothetical protein AB7S26_01100 [Sandaracinaceae bacterium]